MVHQRAKHGFTWHYANRWVIIDNGLALGGLLAGFIIFKAMQCTVECFNPHVLGIQWKYSLDSRG